MDMIASPTIPEPARQTLGEWRKASRGHSSDGTVPELLRLGAPLTEGPAVFLTCASGNDQHWERWWGTPHPKPDASARDSGQHAPPGLPAMSSMGSEGQRPGPRPQPVTGACQRVEGPAAGATQP